MLSKPNPSTVSNTFNTSNTSNTSIYVGDLPYNYKTGHPVFEITDEFLRSLFGEVGNIVEPPNGIVIKERIDKNGKPYAFAFVTFKSREDAEKAINELNYTKLDNTPIRLSLADRETNLIRKSGQGNLFIKNLAADIDTSQLHEAFQNFGEIISCKIPTDDKGVSRGYGYVQFRKPEDAEQAMKDLKDATINNRPVQIEPFRKRQRTNPDENYLNCYIKNLPSSIVDDKDLRDLFSKYGETVSVCLMKDEENKSRGFGYCSMKTHEAAVAAVNELNGLTIGENVIFCGRHQSHQEHINQLKVKSDEYKKANYEKYKGRNLYVRNFDENVTEQDLISEFSRFGNIESAKIMRDDETKVSKKFGFVCFSDEKAADKFIKESTLLSLNGKQVYVAMFMSKADRIKVNALKIAQRSSNPSHHNAMFAMGQGPSFNNSLMYPQQQMPQIQMQQQQMPMGIPQMPMGMPQIPMGMPPQIPQMPMGMPQTQMPQMPQMPMGMPPNQGFAQIPFGGSPYLQLPPKDKLRQEILDVMGPNQIALQRLREMSEEQASALNENQELLKAFLSQA